MKLAELFPALTAAALRLRHEGDVPLAEGLETLVLKLSDHAASEVEDLPLKAGPKGKSEHGSAGTTAEESAIRARLEELLAQAGEPEMTLDVIRTKVSEVCSAATVVSLRKACKTFIHLPLSQKSKGEIQDLLYSQIARRKDRTSW